MKSRSLACSCCTFGLNAKSMRTPSPREINGQRLRDLSPALAHVEHPDHTNRSSQGTLRIATTKRRTHERAHGRGAAEPGGLRLAVRSQGADRGLVGWGGH